MFIMRSYVSFPLLIFELNVYIVKLRLGSGTQALSGSLRLTQAHSGSYSGSLRLLLSDSDSYPEPGSVWLQSYFIP